MKELLKKECSKYFTEDVIFLLDYPKNSNIDNSLCYLTNLGNSICIHFDLPSALNGLDYDYIDFEQDYYFEGCTDYYLERLLYSLQNRRIDLVVNFKED